jgi:hypothetical protein
LPESFAKSEPYTGDHGPEKANEEYSFSASLVCVFETSELVYCFKKILRALKRLRHYAVSPEAQQRFLNSPRNLEGEVLLQKKLT